MNLLKTKEWHWIDIALLKWCVVLFGMIIGAYLHEFVIQYKWLFIFFVIVLGIKPTIAYFRD